jgi:hypothetical protein
LRCARRGGNHKVLRRYVDEVWRIPTDHFDPDAARAFRLREPVPLEQVLVAGSTYPRRRLKERLYASGLKQRACELCGQGEVWRGRRMSLVLDHVNGVRDDNRLENLRIVCPNCNATLDTHCGKNIHRVIDRSCERCGSRFRPRRQAQRFCSRECGQRAPRKTPPRRKVSRPPIAQIAAEVAAEGYSAVGRRYGVSDNAVRKWLRVSRPDAGPTV